MWCIGAAVIVVIVVLPKILEILIGSQRTGYENWGQEDDSTAD
jgi:hypothetical protein